MIRTRSDKTRAGILWLLMAGASAAALSPLVMPWLWGDVAARLAQCHAVMASWEYPGGPSFLFHQLY